MATLSPAGLAEALSDLSLSSQSPKPTSTASKVVAFDALNYLSEFFDIPRSSPTKGKVPPFEAVCAMEIRVAKFAAALEASDLSLLFVVAADTKAAATRRKWTIRRKREIKTEERNVLLSSDVLLSEAFTHHGCRILRPVGADADDVLASLAANPAVASGVISRDGDFFFYRGPRITIYTGWRTVTTGTAEVRIELTPGDPGRYSPNERPNRSVDLSLGERALAASAVPSSSATTSGGISLLHAAGRDKYSPEGKSRGRVERGCTSSSDRRLGNLHVIARPLRAAVYARLGLTEAVTEITPVWNETAQEVEWPEVDVKPDAALDSLLDDVVACERWLSEHELTTVEAAWPNESGFRSKEVQWRNAERRFSRCALAAEIVSAASPHELPKGVLELLKEFPEYAAAKASVDASKIEVPVPKDRTTAAMADTGPPAYSGVCRDCGQGFQVSAEHLAWFEEKGYPLPIRCESCRAAKKASGGGRRGRGRGGRGRRTVFETII